MRILTGVADRKAGPRLLACALTFLLLSLPAPVPAEPAAGLPLPEVFPEATRAGRLLPLAQSDGSLILFDGAWFDPLRHGEPELGAILPGAGAQDPPPAESQRLAVVQFLAAPGPAERALVSTAGATPLFYVPHRAYLVRGDALALDAIRRDPRVRWVGAYRPAYKLDRELGRLAAGWSTAGRLPGEGHESLRLDLLITPGVPAAQAEPALRRALPPGASVELAESGGAVSASVEIPLDRLSLDLAALAGLQEVVAVEPAGAVRLHNDDAVWIGQSYDIFARQNYPVSATVWKQGLLGEGEVIAVADTGVDPDTCWMEDAAGLPTPSNSPALGASAAPMPVDPARRKIIGYNLLGSLEASATAYDVRSGDPHGTWVAVAAAGDNQDHPASEADPVGPHHDSADGMAPLAKLVIEDLGDDTGQLVGLGLPVPRVLDGMFEQQYDAGARISTNSWGSAGNRYDLLAFFADRMAWNHPDFLLVFSAGNGGPFPGSLESPGTAKNVVTTGASEARISPAEDLDPDNVASFSARGPTEDGRLKPDLVMSGKQVITGDSDLGETGRTCALREVNGTSFAAPLTAGFAALAREYYRKGFYPTGAARPADGFIPSAALLKATLIAGARNMSGRGGPNHAPCNIDTCDTLVGLCRNVFAACLDDGDCRRCNGDGNLLCNDDRDCDLSLLQDDAPTSEQGWGRLMLDDALYFTGDTRGLAVWDVERSQGLTTGESWSAEFFVGGNLEDLKLVLTWPDPPALVATPTYLVNDLDLKLTAPDGTVYWGNAWPSRDRSPYTVEYTEAGRRPAGDPDNVEMIRLQGFSLASGVWRVEVVGESVPGSPWADGGARQDFAVVATGPVSALGGTVRFGRQRYACDGEVTVEVVDANRSAPPTVTVGTGSGDSESLTLNDLGGGLFRGTLTLAHGQPIATGDSLLQVTDSETLHATYDDDDPLISSQASALVECSGLPEVASATISGGCDGDGFLDGGERVQLQLGLSNPGRTTLPGLEARLVSSLGEVFVEQDHASFGDLAPGATAAGDQPFVLSLRDGAPPRASVALTLLVTTSDSTQSRRLALTLVTETDEIRTQSSWSEDFTAAAPVCHDGSSDPPANAWYYFDLDQDCATTEDTWEVGFCFGEQRALLPSCSGTWLSTANENQHRLVSPRIRTGNPGSTTVLERVRFDEDYHFRLNEDGLLCDRAVVELFTNGDGRLLHSGYYRDQSADGTAEAVDLDLTEIADFTLPPVPDGTELQLIFHAASNDTATGAASCSGSSGDEYRWRVDNVVLEYENIERVDDATPACDPGCTAPAAPAGVSARTLDDGSVLVGWDPVSGASHYDVHRSLGADDRLAARVPASQTAVLDRPPSAEAWSYSVEAVDATGLCASPRSGAASPATLPPCLAAPAAPAALRGSDTAQATCGIDLDWDPVPPPCGGTLLYRVYRGLVPEFATSPGNLLVETSSLSFADRALLSGWDDSGEPTGTAYHYAVTAFDPVTGVEGPPVRAVFRAGGPRQPGTWLDDGGDSRTAKMTSLTLVDENGAGGGWSRSPIALHHAGAWSYWSDAESFGSGRYPALSCLALESPAIELDPAASPELSIFVDYSIEYQWDGLVIEVAGDDGLFAPIDPVGGYPGDFSQTVAPPCQGAGGGTGNFINACDYPPTQGAITGPPFDGLSGWEEYRFDLSAWAGQAVRFRAVLSTDCGNDGGAVLDDLSVSGALLPSSCQAGSCHPRPVFAGLLSAADPDPQTTGALTLEWGAPLDWGGGGPGTFAIYRDGERIATVGDAARSFTDTGAVANAAHVYQVVARSGGGCELPSSSPSAISVTDCGDPDPALSQQARMTVEVSGSGATLALRSEVIPGAGLYRFPYSHSPQTTGGSPTWLDSAVPEARHDAASDGLTYFYLVEGLRSPACP